MRRESISLEVVFVETQLKERKKERKSEEATKKLIIENNNFEISYKQQQRQH